MAHVFGPDAQGFSIVEASRGPLEVKLKKVKKCDLLINKTVEVLHSIFLSALDFFTIYSCFYYIVYEVRKTSAKVIGYVPGRGFPQGPKPQAFFTDRDILVEIAHVSRSKFFSEPLMKGIQGIKTGGHKFLLEDIKTNGFRISGEDVDSDIEEGDKEDVSTDVEEKGGQDFKEDQENNDEDAGQDDEE